MSNPETDRPHVMFFPLMAQGHMLPTLDMTKLMVNGGVRATIVTTPLNAPFFTQAIQRSTNLCAHIAIRVIPFPAKHAGLRDGLENLDQVTTPDELSSFFFSMSLLQQPLEQLLQECRPHALIAGMFFPWTTGVAAKFGIPRIVLNLTSFFATCAQLSLIKHKPHKDVSSDSQPFLLPGLPDEITLTKLKLPEIVRLGSENDLTRFFYKAFESAASEGYGMIFNSIYELEPSYVEHYKKMGRAWHVGPVSICNRNTDDKAQRENRSSTDEHGCLKWLESKNPNSVVYVCFGTVARFPASQLQEIAMGLEESEQQFIWVVRSENDKNNERESWLPEGFEERMEGKGLIIRGWAPQILILNHKAVGGFVTHCGWNSTMEGVNAGLPMVTWPVFSDQFLNEKLVTDVLKIGVGVGVEKWVTLVGDSVKWDAIAKAVRLVMVGEEAEQMRCRARALAEVCRGAIEVGGSSHIDLKALVDEIRSFATEASKT